MWGAISGVAIVLILFMLYFHRRPKRIIPGKGVVSPASGRIVRIVPYKGGASPVIPKGLLGRVKTMTSDVSSDGTIVVIMLTPLDVHYQRAPLSGKVLSVTHHPGKFRNAVHGARDFGGFENERTEILMQTASGKVKVVQVAGFVARRTRPYVKEGDSLKKGQIIGLITFGSQVLLILPRTSIRAQEGQRVVDGETVIA